MRYINLFYVNYKGIDHVLILVRRELKMSAERLLPQRRASYEERAQATQTFKAVGPLENSYSSNYILLLQSNVKFGLFLHSCFHLKKP